MEISMTVRYDEDRMRRTAKFLLRPQVRLMRLMAVLLLFLGAVLIALQPGSPVGYVIAVLAPPLIAFWVPVRTVQRVLALLPPTARQEQRVVLDDDGFGCTSPLAESRMRWAAVQSVEETEEAWHLMTGPMQAMTVPKAEMTGAQRTEFATFLATNRAAAATVSDQR